MPGILIMYYSESGNTEKMASFVKKGVDAEDVEADLKKVGDVSAKDLLGYDGIIVGSPTYYGTMAADIKRLFDESVEFHSQLEGKAGAAFSSSAHIGGGNETTILDILHMMLIHGMVVQGDSKGDHYGPVSVRKPDNRVEQECVRLGKRTARLVKKLLK